MRLVREAKDTEQHNRSGTLRTYASVAAGNGLATSMHNPLNQLKAPPSQVLREIIVNVRNPLTVASLRAMNPRSLKAHVDRAIEQSGNEHIEKIKTASTNQQKSGDLSIKTATTSDMEILRQFAEDWEHRLGIGASVRIPTYGVLVHGIRTSSMDVGRFEDTRDNILQENRPFIPNAGIKYIGWLTRTAATKSASSVIIEFIKPQDANKIIDEGLIWQGEVFQCELYDRSCRLRQCFSCQRYGHLGTQCKATTRCGYCAQEHASRECCVKWIASLLQDRYTRISIDGFKTERHKVLTGTVQGSPLSPILYIFYNADLVEKCDLEEETTATGFIDDVAILTWGGSTIETCNKLQRALQRAEQ
jgi:hypothetical protein